MKHKELTNSELKFAEMIWASAPIASMDLVRLSEAEMGWKKSTTFTMVKILRDKGIIRNENAVISVEMSKDEYLETHSRRYVEDTFGGSLPRFLASFMGGGKLTDKQAGELMQLIEDFKER